MLPSMSPEAARREPAEEWAPRLGAELLSVYCPDLWSLRLSPPAKDLRNLLPTINHGELVSPPRGAVVFGQLPGPIRQSQPVHGGCHPGEQSLPTHPPPKPIALPRVHLVQSLTPVTVGGCAVDSATATAAI